ncbi:hypothetical protein K504DRAFT_4450 [Pleomassaria siparia CBS 279.74]|uniref:Transcription factor hoxa13 n=1 Tax=Pleomassaria siparia CBS 279.74 TaxID=1314801 RepID=A0A6G1KNP3_9PLEO|nr:hypothetical protein K504DRAFT_4450 [Pleomassaria siparia CBS 279.74]
MAVQSNGHAKKLNKPASNGNTNGHLNGHLNASLNGHTDKSQKSGPITRTPKSRSRKTAVGSLTSIFGRLISWYIIITVFFRCPSSISQINDTAPQVCKPYLHARAYAAPYLDPYYQAHVAPQVKKIQPYIDRFETQVYTPVSTFTKDKYATYGAHRVEQTQKYIWSEWDRTVHPQLQKAQHQVKGQYDLHLYPHVKKASDAVAPHYERAKDSLVEIYQLAILPTYKAILPYSHQAFIHGNHVLVHVFFPHVRSAKDYTWTFVTRSLWPQVRVLYGDNVEPQLVRIQERLGRYRDQQKMESAVEALESEPTVIAETTEIASSSIEPSVTASAVSKSGWEMFDDILGAESTATTATSKVETKTATQPAVPKLTGAELQAKLNDDLRKWQTKFATAADKGAEDLEVRVEEITQRQIENGVKGHGAALVIQLEETADSVVASFKNYINHIVKALPEDPTEEDLNLAFEKSVAKTRELGITVKEKAQAIRTWKAAHDQETDSLVQSAVASTVEVLERIHGLGLQEVGMRWAWTDGVTYKDWQNYHKLRNTLTEWQAEVEAVGSRHDGLKTAHEEAKNIEDGAMAIASKMVGELVRLKDVSKWKIWAGDSTDDFSDKAVPARVFKAAQNVINNAEEAVTKVSAAVVGSETPATESIASVVKDEASDISSKVAESIATGESLASEASYKASEALVGSQSDVESISSTATQSIESATENLKENLEETASVVQKAPKKVMGGAMAQIMVEAREIVLDDVIEDDDGTYSAKVQSMVAEAGDRAADLTRAVSEALLGPEKTQGSVESATSLASEQYAKAIAAASSVLYGTEQKPIESATSVASEKFAQAVTA